MDEYSYYAKSELKNGARPTVAEHLRQVSALAGRFAKDFGRSAEGETLGLTHDIGKYGQRFQNLLHGDDTRVDHAFSSAAWLYGRHPKKRRTYTPLIEAVNAHHSALTPLSLLENRFLDSLRGTADVEGNEGRTAALCGEEYQSITALLNRDLPDFEPKPVSRFQCAALEPKYEPNLEQMLYTRFLFSCLVDADYCVSAEEEDCGFLSGAGQEDFDPSALLASLYRYRDSLARTSTAEPGLNALRGQVFDRCGAMGAHPAGLFTLTAPTGTGKTLAMLHFALRHCLANGQRRIIFVLPYLTLTEQNAQVYRSIVPDLLEDHSQSNLSEQYRLFAQRWSVPVIVTTSVRFFETLFASRPTDCRKLHSIANSVVLFDEAQTLPVPLTEITLRSVKELCRSYHTSVVFSTATQPHYNAIKGLDWRPTELLPDHPALYERLRRTAVQWRLEQATSWETLAGEMAEQQSVCAIVNLRRHARRLYGLLEARCGSDACFFLTTDLCPAHRSQVIGTIRGRLSQGLPCRVVATQCIEAGVDLDFDAVYRALAPLESIVQAAGRCNRNGRLSQGEVTVFVPDGEETLYPESWYALAAEVVREQNRAEPIDIHNPAHIRRYYETLFHMEESRRNKELTQAIEDKDYQETDRHYHIIDRKGVQIIVPYQGERDLFETIAAQTRAGGITPALIRAAAPITVSCYDRQAAERIGEPPLLNKGRGYSDDAGDSGYYILRAQHESCYDSRKLGLRLDSDQKLFL